MRVVIDTNVFISSFFGTGSPRKIIDFWKEGRITICLSNQIIDEYVEVLEKLGLMGEREILEILQLFAHGFNSLFARKTPELEIVEDDPDDNKFFECAVAFTANFIVSGDKKILELEEYIGIKVVSPKQFVDKTQI